MSLGRSVVSSVWPCVDKSPAAINFFDFLMETFQGVSIRSEARVIEMTREKHLLHVVNPGYFD